jgi:hypothetical protein
MSARCSSGSGEPMERIAAAGSAAVHRPHLYVSCRRARCLFVTGAMGPNVMNVVNGAGASILQTLVHHLQRSRGLHHLIMCAFCNLQSRNFVPVSAQQAEALRTLLRRAFCCRVLWHHSRATERVRRGCVHKKLAMHLLALCMLTQCQHIAVALCQVAVNTTARVVETAHLWVSRYSTWWCRRAEVHRLGASPRSDTPAMAYFTHGSLHRLYCTVTCAKESNLRSRPKLLCVCHSRVDASQRGAFCPAGDSRIAATPQPRSASACVQQRKNHLRSPPAWCAGGGPRRRPRRGSSWSAPAPPAQRWALQGVRPRPPPPTPPPPPSPSPATPAPPTHAGGGRVYHHDDQAEASLPCYGLPAAAESATTFRADRGPASLRSTGLHMQPLTVFVGTAPHMVDDWRCNGCFRS